VNKNKQTQNTKGAISILVSKGTLLFWFDKLRSASVCFVDLHFCAT